MFNPEKILAQLPENLRPLVFKDHPLNLRTTLGVGGPATLLCEAKNTDQALRFQEIALSGGLPFFILGGGSNILAADEGFAGLVLRIDTRQFTRKAETLTVGAGLDFDDLIRRSLEVGLSGLEFASGIPGTLGGAIMGNAGCYGHEIGEFVEEALTLGSDGVVRRRGPEDFGFRYRATNLRESGEILLEATLRLSPGGVDEATKVREEKIADRRLKHPVDLPSAGSWFRNLPAPGPGQRRVAAGSLLEQVGAKDMSEGDARVFAKHANMIVNTGKATSHQVETLARRMKDAVREKFQVELVQEVRQLG